MADPNIPKLAPWRKNSPFTREELAAGEEAYRAEKGTKRAPRSGRSSKD